MISIVQSVILHLSRASASACCWTYWMRLARCSIASVFIRQMAMARHDNARLTDVRNISGAAVVATIGRAA